MSLRDLKEKFLVAIVFTGIFLPVRLLFFTYVSEHWVGSFGVMTILLVCLMYLANKGKLGYIGRIINIQIRSFSRGKYGKFSLFYLVFWIYLYSLFIYGASYSNPETTAIYTEQLAAQGITDIKSASTAENVGWSGPMAGLGILFSIIIILVPNQLGFALYDIINTWTDGWMVHFSLVLLVESLEALGLVIYFRYRNVGKTHDK